jgi:hypothetical protein
MYHANHGRRNKFLFSLKRNPLSNTTIEDIYIHGMHIKHVILNNYSKWQDLHTVNEQTRNKFYALCLWKWWIDLHKRNYKT